MHAFQNGIISAEARMDLENTFVIDKMPLYSLAIDTSNNYTHEMGIIGENEEPIILKEEIISKEVFSKDPFEDSKKRNTIQELTESDLDEIAPKSQTKPKMFSEQVKSNELPAGDIEMSNYISESSFQFSHETNRKREEPIVEKSFDVSSFLEKFGLKEENIRQTVIRRFKFSMKKISQDIRRYKKISNAKYLKLIFRIMKLYSLGPEDRDYAENAYLEIRNLIDQVNPDSFEATYDGNSCNDSYVRRLFQDPIMKELYHLHHLLGSRGEYYFKKFKQFQHKNLKEEEQRQICAFCDNFLNIYAPCI